MSLAANATPEERLELVENRLGTEVFLLMPTVFAYPATGLLLANRARKLLGDLAEPGELQTVMRGLPHNVTTEMDLELWQLTQRVRADHDSAQAFLDGSTAELTARYATGRFRRSPSAASPPSCAATGIARWPRSTWGCRAGRTTRATSRGDRQLPARSMIRSWPRRSSSRPARSPPSR